MHLRRPRLPRGPCSYPGSDAARRGALEPSAASRFYGLILRAQSPVAREPTHRRRCTSLALLEELKHTADGGSELKHGRLSIATRSMSPSDHRPKIRGISRMSGPSCHRHLRATTPVRPSRLLHGSRKIHITKRYERACAESPPARTVPSAEPGVPTVPGLHPMKLRSVGRTERKLALSAGLRDQRGGERSGPGSCGPGGVGSGKFEREARPRRGRSSR
jgi:hypothetical protein